MIFKCQYPLASSKVGRILIHNRKQTVYWTEPVTPAWTLWFSGRQKVYVEGHTEDSVLVIDKELDNQSW